jgi:phosphinothricin acetyltransferase
MKYVIRNCTEKQLPEILAIYNDVILNSTALYEYKPYTMNIIQSWYSAKLRGNYPILGAFNQDEMLLGFATFGPFRDYPAYKYTVEHSIYIRSDRRGQGLGKMLLGKLIENAEAQDYHVMIAAIDALNIASIKFHEKARFVFCGKIKDSGYKFGKWLDLAFYQLILKTPINPVDDK